VHQLAQRSGYHFDERYILRFKSKALDIAGRQAFCDISNPFSRDAAPSFACVQSGTKCAILFVKVTSNPELLEVQWSYPRLFHWSEDEEAHMRTRSKNPVTPFTGHYFSLQNAAPQVTDTAVNALKEVRIVLLGWVFDSPVGGLLNFTIQLCDSAISQSEPALMSGRG